MVNRTAVLAARFFFFCKNRCRFFVQEATLTSAPGARLVLRLRDIDSRNLSGPRSNFYLLVASKAMWDA